MSARRAPSGSRQLSSTRSASSDLTNEVRGWRGFGRAHLTEVVARDTRKRTTIRESVMLIRIKQEYRFGMISADLYDATRGVWAVGPRRERVEYPFSVFEGTVRGVYRITQ